jgi:hypothetical protein
MDDFSYLTILISIVLGLGITNLLTGFAALVRGRGRVKIYWPMPMWMLTLFLVHVQTWWAMFTLRSIREWNFGAFLVVLIQPVCLFVMAALIVPASSRIAEIDDTRKAYFRESPWFFAFLLLALCDSVVKNLVLYGSVPETSNFCAHLIFSGVALVGIFFRGERTHKILAPLAVALITGYIAILFAKLS